MEPFVVGWSFPCLRLLESPWMCPFQTLPEHIYYQKKKEESTWVPKLKRGLSQCEVEQISTWPWSSLHDLKPSHLHSLTYRNCQLEEEPCILLWVLGGIMGLKCTTVNEKIAFKAHPKKFRKEGWKGAGQPCLPLTLFFQGWCDPRLCSKGIWSSSSFFVFKSGCVEKVEELSHIFTEKMKSASYVPLWPMSPHPFSIELVSVEIKNWNVKHLYTPLVILSNPAK